MSISRRNRFDWLRGIKNVLKPIIALVVLVAIIIWTTGILRERVSPDTIAREPGFPLPHDAQVHVAEKKPFSRMIDITGTVSSRTMVNVSARINAHVTGVHAGAGSVVTRGDLLLSLDDRELQEQLAAAEAGLFHAQTEFKRVEGLFESGSATHRDYTAAQYEYRNAMAHKNEIEVMLSFTQLTSPIDGVVTQRFVETGDFAAAGTVLMTVYDPSAMRLEVPVPVRLMERIAIGDVMPVQLEAPAQRTVGKVSEIVSEIDPSTRTRTIKVELSQDSGVFIPGAFGRIYIESEPEEGIFVPITSVYRIGQLEMIHYVSDGRVIRRLVKTGPVHISGELVEILSGVSHGDAILVHPVHAAPVSSIAPHTNRPETGS
jgi:membrane fusion protein, multidrug efflux system